MLRSIRSHPPPGIRIERAATVMWRVCGGPLDDVPRLLQHLDSAELVTQSAGHLTLTKSGRLVATQDHQSGGRLLAVRLIRAGFFSAQARRLIRECVEDTDGRISCNRDTAISVAPQLVGVLKRWSNVDTIGRIHIPQDVLGELIEAIDFAPEGPEQRADRRKAIGNRAESYSYRFERLRAADPTYIRWVSLDDEGLGYDIEDAAAGRYIEVKGGTSNEVQFFLSSNEWKVLQQHGPNYEVQYWGMINLSVRKAHEYKRLREAGYPIIYPDMRSQFTIGRLQAQPHVYVVRPNI